MRTALARPPCLLSLRTKLKKYQLYTYVPHCTITLLPRAVAILSCCICMYVCITARPRSKQFAFVHAAAALSKWTPRPLSSLSQIDKIKHDPHKGPGCTYINTHTHRHTPREGRDVTAHCTLRQPSSRSSYAMYISRYPPTKNDPTFS